MPPPAGTTADAGFEWGDAAIGAGLAVLMIGGGLGILGAHRRRGSRAIAPIS